MSMQTPLAEENLNLSKFIDFDKIQNTFYDNVYLDDYKFVVKIPLLKDKSQKDIRIKKFTLENYTFLFSYE
ncbi:MAG: hypothetical protein JW891_11345 [Candidatus Lokiarchaeota archaeon]|nr:hypothetical protein [Candidatus Lokiarchaeota archaeon]